MRRLCTTDLTDRGMTAALALWHLQARAAAYRRTLTAGRSAMGKAVTILHIELQELGTWLLCGLMCATEAIALRDWLQGPGARSWLPHIAK